MYKEIIIIMVVISLIVGLDIITNNYTKQSLEIMTSELNILRKYILNEDKTKAQEQMKFVKEKWEERDKVLAFYIEHDELEKVETELTGLSADINAQEYKHCIAELDTTIFILEHIQDKEKIQLISIF